MIHYETNNFIILFSGGIDSTYVLSTLLQTNQSNNILCLYFNYGQKYYQGEINSAKKICNNLGIKIKEINISDIYSCTKDNAMLSNNQSTTVITKRHQVDGNIQEEIYLNKKTTELLFRNNLFVICAAILGKTYFNEEVFNILIGINKNGDFKDCSQEFVNNMNTILKCQDSNGTLFAPIINMDKLEIINDLQTGIYKELINQTWSCYESNSLEECHQCYNCICKRLLNKL